VHLTFNEPVDPGSFTADQVASFSGPDGDIAITSVSAVPFTNNTQFNVFFDAQSTLGDYTMVLGRGIQDLYGNALENADPVRFSIRTISVFDPDNYADNQRLDTVFPGVTLSYLRSFGGHVIALPAAGGARVFGGTGDATYSPEFYDDDTGYQMRINFDAPVSFVSIDAIGTNHFSTQVRGLLRIFNAAGQELARVTTPSTLAPGQVATMTLSRPTADIAYAWASSDNFLYGVLLDDLSFASSSGPVAVPVPGRSYSIPGIEPGHQLFGELLHTGWTQAESAGALSNINLVSGQNQTGLDIANIQDTEPRGFRAPPPPGRALAASESVRIRDPFEDPTDSNDWWWA
jgi:hypothetical protein